MIDAAIGAGVTGFTHGQRVAALTVYGAFAEYLTREAEDFLPIPDAVSDQEAAAVILNYITAWQMIHRTVNVQPGKTALVTGAAGGVGTAALQLLRLAGVKTYGAASKSKHDTIRALGAIPIDSHAGPVDRSLRALEPNGVDYAFDAVGGPSVSACTRALRRGGTLVGFGFMGTAPSLIAQLSMFANIFVGSRLRGRTGKFYGITMLYRKKIRGSSLRAKTCPKSSLCSPRKRSTPQSRAPCPCSKPAPPSNSSPPRPSPAKSSSPPTDRVHREIATTKREFRREISPLCSLFSSVNSVIRFSLHGVPGHTSREAWGPKAAGIQFRRTMNSPMILPRLPFTAALAALLAIPACSQSAPKPSDSDLAAITQRGTVLANYDQAARYATTAVELTQPAAGKIVRYICPPDRHRLDSSTPGRLNSDATKFLHRLQKCRPERCPHPLRRRHVRSPNVEGHRLQPFRRPRPSTSRSKIFAASPTSPTTSPFSPAEQKATSSTSTPPR